MTIAKGAIQKMKDIYSLVPKHEVPDQVVDDLDNFFSVCIKLCVVYYGNNNNSLSEALPKFIKDEKNCSVCKSRFSSWG